jgi:transcriptional regulator with XRE-family HTH domain
MITIAAPIKRILHEKRLRQSAICEESGVTVDCMADYTGGVREPTLMDFVAIADTLHVSLDELAGRETYTEMERDLVSSFRELNEEGREVACDLVFSMKVTYKKNYKDGMVAA